MLETADIIVDLDSVTLSSCPHDIILSIALYLDIEDLPHLLLCSKHVYSLKTSCSLWITALAQIRRLRPLSIPSKAPLHGLPLAALTCVATRAIRTHRAFTLPTPSSQAQPHITPHRSEVLYMRCIPLPHRSWVSVLHAHSRIVALVPGMPFVLVYTAAARLDLWCVDTQRVVAKVDIAGGEDGGEIEHVRTCEAGTYCFIAFLCRRNTLAREGFLNVVRVDWESCTESATPPAVSMQRHFQTPVVSTGPWTRVISSLFLSTTIVGIIWNSLAVNREERIPIEMWDMETGRRGRIRCNINGIARHSAISFFQNKDLHVVVDSEHLSGRTDAHVFPASLLDGAFPPPSGPDFIAPNGASSHEGVIITATPSTRSLTQNTGWDHRPSHAFYNGLPSLGAAGVLVRTTSAPTSDPLINDHPLPHGRSRFVLVEFLSLAPHVRLGPSVCFPGSTLTTLQRIHTSTTAQACLVVLTEGSGEHPLRLVYHDVMTDRLSYHALVLPEEVPWSDVASVVFDEAWGRLMMLDMFGGLWVVPYC